VLGALPVAGRFLRWIGFRPASRKEVVKCLEKTYPRNITVMVPGGIQDKTEAHRLWVERLRNAFDNHKAEFGWPEKKLLFEGEEIPALPEDPLEMHNPLPSLSKL